MTVGESFIAIGLFSLILQTFKDLKTMKIDSLKNHIMIGLVIGAYIFTGIDILIFFAGTALAIGFGHLTKDLFGEGDREMFVWIFPGLALLDYWYPIIFMMATTLVTGINFAIKHEKKIDKKTPGMPIILGAYLLTAAIYVGYLI